VHGQAALVNGSGAVGNAGSDQLAVVPFGPVASVAGVRTPLQLADLPAAVLLVLA
jgi:hypothetical protein